MEKKNQVEIILLHDWIMPLVSCPNSQHLLSICISSVQFFPLSPDSSEYLCLKSAVNAIALLGLNKIAFKPWTPRLKSWVSYLLAMWLYTRAFRALLLCKSIIEFMKSLQDIETQSNFMESGDMKTDHHPKLYFEKNNYLKIVVLIF